MISNLNRKLKPLKLGSTSTVEIYIITDSEWDCILDLWLCTPVLVRKAGISYLYFFAWEGLPHKEIMKDWCNSNYINFVELPKYGMCLTYLIDSLDLSGEAHLRFFYSLKDITYLIGEEAAREIYLHNLEKKRVISGKFKICTENYSLTLHCKDAVGWSNKGLADLATAVGVEMENKSSMDEYKNNMIRGAEENPLEFIQYAIDDVVKLDEIFEKYLNLIQWVQIELLRISPEDAFTINTIPMTIGSIVAKSFEKWIVSNANNSEMLEFAIKKLGYPKTRNNQKLQQKDVEAFLWASKSWSMESLKQHKNTELYKNFIEGINFEGLAYTGATIPTVGSHSHKLSTACFNAIVQGGRCNNEIPTQYRLENVLDIDLQSCYGSSLRKLIYPIGLPRTWFYTPTEKKPNLGDFLKKYLDKFEPGLWQIIVEGTLNFNQDLIFSKDVKGSDINKAVNGGLDPNKGSSENEDISHIPGTFCLLRKEIVKGIITEDILDVIQKVSSNRELKQWMNLEVITAMAWCKEDKCEGEEEFIEKTLEYSGDNLVGKEGGQIYVEDKRPHYWYAIPLENFIGKLIDERNKLKKLGNLGDITASCKQNVVKLFINTLYGDFASPFFSISNTVLANNITARARVGVWLMAKALILRQTITDGSIYTPQSVAYFEGQNPGFETLNDMSEWHYPKKGRYTQSLGNINWNKKFEEFKSTQDSTIQNFIDNLALEHIEKFWKPYKLSLKHLFNIEHKIEHTASKAAYISKGHYALKTLKTEKRIYRVRGSIRYTDKELRENPIYRLLDSILDGNDLPGISALEEYDHKKLLSLSDWQQAQKLNGFENYKALMPGDEVVDKRLFRLNNHYFHANTLKEYLSKFDRKKEMRGKPICFFEKYLEEGIAKMYLMMIKNKL